MTAFINRIVAKRFGCLQDIDVELTPIHAFIGPNDSGKSTILSAVRTIVQLASACFRYGPSKEMKPFTPRIPGEGEKYLLLARFGKGFIYQVEASSEKITETVLHQGKILGQESGRSWTDTSKLLDNKEIVELREKKAGRISTARMVRLDPDALRRPSGLIPDNQPISFLNDRGFGLPGVLDAIQNRGDDDFKQIADELRELFPAVKNLRLKVISEKEKKVAISLKGGREVSADHISEGMLYYLAFAALARLEPTSVLLVEEPENGLHPARIADVMRTLRKISQFTQVLIATHSPLVINEMEANEVTLVTRPDGKSTKTIPLSDTHNFEERKKVYALGELWLSYADGVDESPLLSMAREE